MANLYGHQYTKAEILKKVGDISQIAGTKSSILSDGREKGVSMVDFRTGSGFNFSVIPDRGLDIAWAEYNGMAVSFMSRTGVANPSYFEPEAAGFLRNFYVGLLTTCGISYMGVPCQDGDENLGLHGYASNTPAQNVCVTGQWDGDDYVMKISGTIREAVMHKPVNLALHREIETRLGEKKLIIRDHVENLEFVPSPLMMLYHVSFGFPIIDKGTRLIIPNNANVRPRDKTAAKGLETWAETPDPISGFEEQVFYHFPEPESDGSVTCKFINDNLGEDGTGVYLKYFKDQLPCLSQWKYLNQGDYVHGFEAGTWYPEGRAACRQKGEMTYIQPGEIREFEMEIGIL